MFTIGNLITLGIVVAVLIIYRLLDKNSKSLDKVRRYTDKYKEDFASYAEEKGAAVRDFGIALEVEQKAASELMKRIQTFTEKDLAQSVKALSGIDERIRSYDSSLEELVKMTGRVQENLNRLRDESAFVESTGKRIGEAKEKLEHIEKGIGVAEKRLDSTETRFERENAESLEKALAEALQIARSTVADFQASAETIERKVEDHREAVNAAERQRETGIARDLELINQTLREAVAKAGSQADKMEDAALVKLREQAQDRVNQIKALLEEKIKSVQESARTGLGEIQEQLRSNREEWKTETAAIEAQQQAYRAEWEKDTQKFDTLVQQQQQELGSAIAQQREELSAVITQQQQSLSAAIAQQQ
ncbi:MAG: hypothetical protein LBH97_06065, partial [Treponema sp.]|nr:hypothetical protein [Treponema sp.]